MATKHKVILATTKEDFEKQLDATSEEHNVFATQTHIRGDGFIAVCFIRPTI